MITSTVRTYARTYVPEAMESPVRIPFPVDFSDFRPPGRIIVQSYEKKKNVD